MRLTTLFVIIFITQLYAQLPYKQYCNGRYALCVKYPVTFGVEPAPFNNDGRVFYDGEGFSMRVYGSQNALEHTMKDEMREEASQFDTVTYKVAKRNWYVLSGYSGRDIVYIKTYMRDDVFYHLHIKYPIKLKAEYGDIVSQVSRSFKIK